MAATPYRAVSWEDGELLGDEKMDQLTNNVQWVYENTPRAKLQTDGGLNRLENLKFVGGMVVIRKKTKSDNAAVTVNFNSFFSNGCQPSITTGVNSPTHKNTFVTFRGIGELRPDHQGFQVTVEIDESKKKQDRITRAFLIHWQALGY